MNSFFTELSRRNVTKIATVYAIVAWMLVQIIVAIEAPLHLPDWVDTLIIILLIVGFPIAMVIAWAFELTPGGIKYSNPANSNDKPSKVTSHKLNYTIISLLVITLGYVLIDNYVFTEQASMVAQPSITPGNLPLLISPFDKSVAVLPFQDLSPDMDQGYFSDGISEEILNTLSRIQGLQVAGPTSSFFFKNRDIELSTVGEMLGVAYILEGSVRKSGNQLRITARLNNSATGFTLWSESYNRIVDDIFNIQEDIATSVAGALQISLGVGQLGELPGMTRNVAAYEAVLLSNAVDNLYSPDGLRTRIEHLERAVRIDPNFSFAWIQLNSAYATAQSVIPGGLPQGAEKSAQALERASVISPDSPFVHIRMMYDTMAEGDWIEADRLWQSTLQSASKYSLQSSAHVITAQFLNLVGRSSEAVDYLELYRVSEPLDMGAAMLLADNYAYLGKFEDSFAETDRGMTLWGDQLRLRGNALLVALASKDRTEIDMRLAQVYEAPAVEPFSAAVGQLLDTPSEALAELHRLQSLPENQTVLALMISSEWAAYFADPEYALDNLSILAEINQRTLVASLVWHPLFIEMRKLEGFKDLMHKVGLVEYWRATGNWNDYCQPVNDDFFECR